MKKRCADSVDGGNIASDQEGPFVATRVTFRFLRPPPPFYAMFGLLYFECPCMHEILQVNIAFLGGEGGKTKSQLFFSTRPCLSRGLFTCSISSFHCTGDGP